MLQGLTLSPSANKEIAQALAIETHKLSKSYGDTKAVVGLDLAIPEGQFFGLLGRNGSGKTTTLHMLSTLIRPTRGEARVATLWRHAPSARYRIERSLAWSKSD